MNRSILVVEDDPMMIAFIEEYLSGVCEYKLMTRADLAFSLLRAGGNFSMVLLDLFMPGMDGFQTAEKLQSLVERGEVPDSFIIMMFTSSKNPRDRERAEVNPLIKGYIVKPIDDAAVEQIKALQAGESG